MSSNEIIHGLIDDATDKVVKFVNALDKRDQRIAALEQALREIENGLRADIEMGHFEPDSPIQQYIAIAREALEEK